MASQDKVTLAQALEQIQSSKLEDRRRGFDNLKHVLTFNRSDRSLFQLEEKAVHAIFEVLFRVNSSERASYVKGGKGTTGAASASRLALGATVLRLAVTVFVDRLKRKTARAVIGHVIQALPTADGKYCEPLSLDYLKTFRCIVDYQPHVEHFDGNLWTDALDFCVEGLSIAEPEDNASISDDQEPQLSGSRASSKVSSWKGIRAATIDNIVELLGILRSLVAAPNAPLQEKTSQILKTAITFLRISTSTTSGHHAAIQSINTTLGRASHGSGSVMLQSLFELLPIVRNLWQFTRKDPALENELLILMIHLQAYLASVVQTRQGGKYIDGVEALADAMYSDCCDPRKSERGNLELEDLGFDLRRSLPVGLMPMQTVSFHLRRATQKSERNWTELHFISLLISWVDIQTSFSKQSARHDDSGDHTRKRRKMHVKLDEILERTVAEQLEQRAASLRVVVFVMHQRIFAEEELIKIVGVLMSSAHHSDGNVSSWALLGIASCAFQRASSGPNLDLNWTTAWNLAVRLVSSTTYCRAACHLLGVLLVTKKISYADIVESAETMLSSFSLTGPALLCDSALDLWSILYVHKVARHPGATIVTDCEQMLNWICAKWSPSDFESRTHSRQLCCDVSAPAVYAAFRQIGLGRCTQDSVAGFATLGTIGQIGQAWLAHWRSREVLDHTLLLESCALQLSIKMEREILTNDTSQPSSRIDSRLDGLLLKFFQSETDDIQQVWTDSKNQTAFNAETAFVTFSYCIVGLLVCAALSERMPTRASSATLKLEHLSTEVILSSFRRHPSRHDRIVALLEAISVFLPDLTSIAGSDDVLSISTALSSVLHHLKKAMDSYSGEQAANSAGFQPQIDLMDIDDEAPVMDSTLSSVYSHTRPTLSAELTGGSFFASAAGYVSLLSIFSDSTAEVEEQTTTIPASFVQYLLSLPSHTFLSSRPLLEMLLASPIQLLPEDTESLIKFMGENFLSTYSWSRCEDSLQLCLIILTGTARLWTEQAPQSLFDAGADVYTWFLESALDAGVLSPQAQMSLVDLLYKLLNVQPDYAQSLSLPSARTTLFSVLKNGELVVQYHVARRLPVVFGSFVLNQHELIFQDIINSLPESVEWKEGIILRLLVFTVLGSTWKTLLRRCLYSIFETAGLVKAVLPHATEAVARLVRALSLIDGPELFRLFSPQLIYSWLDHQQTLEAIPFGIFGYESQRTLIMDVRAEVISQLMMRGADYELKQLEIMTGTPAKAIPGEWFAQATAYGIAKDMFAPSKAEPAIVRPHNTEGRIRDIFGSDDYKAMLAKQIHLVVGYLFLRLEHEENIDKVFLKRDGYKQATEILRQLKSNTATEKQLPTSQQPSFRPKAFLDAIERLCRRIKRASVNTQTQKADLWHPVLVVAVTRILFNDIHPVFGPSHACRTLRKIRVLVALAGPTALTAYPLEMLLQAVRPYLTDSHCADEALGLFQYLLDQGKQHLQQSYRFIAGLCLPVFLSLQEFLRSSSDSTTQESQHRSTLSRARNFHDWLSRYLDTYSPAGPASSESQAFHSLMDLARRISEPISANAGSVESDLLRMLLGDLKSKSRILGPASISLCFSKLCRSFSAPVNYRHDLLGGEKDAKLYTIPVWESLRHAHLSNSYMLWASKVLGRSFGYTGQLADRINVESDCSRRLTIVSREPNRIPTSVAAIISALVDTLMSGSSQAIGYAEQSLQNVLLNYDSTGNSHKIDAYVPPALLDTFSSSEHDLSCNTATDHGKVEPIKEYFLRVNDLVFSEWIRRITLMLVYSAKDEPLLRALPQLLRVVDGLAEELFPFVLHLVLINRSADDLSLQQEISEGFQHCFDTSSSTAPVHTRALINAVLYLRCQKAPSESSLFDRNKWLTLDYYTAASAAMNCRMFKTATLFCEIAQTMSSKKSGSKPAHDERSYDGLLVSIFRSLDEPDSYYGVEQSANLDSIIDRHDFEGNGMQSLFFRSAQLDSLSRGGRSDTQISGKLIRSLTKMSLNNITYDLAEGQAKAGEDPEVMDGVLNAAFKLGQWDVAVPQTSKSIQSILYRTFQSIHNATSIDHVLTSLDRGLMDSFIQFNDTNTVAARSPSPIQAMASLTEIHEIVDSKDVTQLDEILARLKGRDGWMSIGQLDIVSPILSSRSAFAGILSTNERLRELLHLETRDVRRAEVELELQCSTILRKLGALQGSLSSGMYLSKLVDPCKHAGVNVEVAVKQEVSNILWDRGELVPSIQLLRDVSRTCDFAAQSLRIGRSEILATLGQRVSHARLENPAAIVNNYLSPAMTELKSQSRGAEASHAFHEYASYCHNQLTNADNIEEYRRSERFRRQKIAEIKEIKSTVGSSKTTYEKRQTEKAQMAAETWYRIDDLEYQRLRGEREQFLRDSLSSYLRTLSASDDFDTDITRFTALWLEYANDEVANEAVANLIANVPSRKFAPLMNQLGSRLQNLDNSFQRILGDLVERICEDHPYHGMYHVFAGSRSTGGSDSQAMARKMGATNIAARLQSKKGTTQTWNAIGKSNDLFIRLAKYKFKDDVKTNAKITMRAHAEARRVERDVPSFHVPPITLSIELREDFDYSSVPTVTSFQPEMSILGGISAPKLLIAIASDGRQHRQLFKGGTDDLRQDAIMEQVFAQVTEILRHNKSTRQRELGIRTYKVTPLDATSGAIEFVPYTMSLLDYLSPAHAKYHPNEYSWRTCRDKIERGADLTQASRIKIFREIKDRFSPVLRHFFFEKFQDPDDWFTRRLAYTRSTAAISILGHVLGLGDRHCQNVLLDTQSGEVVHIDLGVAFDAGRILPKPETVPFRLTRDIIDGFGVLKTEGVFRRCCEFTLEALRQNKETILTLLNVLRYDPLYSWSVSPLRAKRLQEEQQAAEASATPSTVSKRTSKRNSMLGGDFADVDLPAKVEKLAEEGGEADRALSVVEKKLAGGLSVTAAVNELIQQATDDKNLAVLFHGWSAYA